MEYASVQTRIILWTVCLLRTFDLVKTLTRRRFPSFSDVSKPYPSRQTCDKISSSSALNMALEGQSPQVRKNVMAAAVSAAAMPALASTLTALSATAIPAAVATQFAQAVWLPSAANDWRVLTAVFLAHWFVTNQILQQFPDESEIAVFKKAETKKRM